MEDVQRRRSSSDRKWQRWTLQTITVFAVTMVMILAVVLFIDPYDSGRFISLGIKGESLFFQRYSNVGLGRAERFNAAIFGNSHGQILNPRSLSDATGLKIVQLATPGANPREILTLLRWFLKHHPNPEALVLALDERWCNPDPSLPVTTAFPFWLYEGNLKYIANMISTRSVRDAYERVMFGLGRRQAADPDGYDSYETGKVRHFKAEPPALLTPHREVEPAESPVSYPPVDALDKVLQNVPRETRLVIALPPQFASRVAQNDLGINRCKRALARLTEDRAGGFIDYLVQSPITRNSENFWDDEHYTSQIGQLIERDIAAKLNAGK